MKSRHSGWMQRLFIGAHSFILKGLFLVTIVHRTNAWLLLRSALLLLRVRLLEGFVHERVNVKTERLIPKCPACYRRELKPMPKESSFRYENFNPLFLRTSKQERVIDVGCVTVFSVTATRGKVVASL